ncbi:MAG: hypothetical protein ABI810_17555 [Sphingomonas bacterium]
MITANAGCYLPKFFAGCYVGIFAPFFRCVSMSCREFGCYRITASYQPAISQQNSQLSARNSQVTASARAKTASRSIYLIDTAKERKSTNDGRAYQARRMAACIILPLD